MKGSDVISALKTKLKASTNRALAKRIGVTSQAIFNWNNRKTITPRQIAGLINRSIGAGASDLRTNAIRPLVEFFRVEWRDSDAREKPTLFRLTEKDGKRYPYLVGLRDELNKAHGIYIFFD